MAVHYCLVALVIANNAGAVLSAGDSNVTACMRLSPLITHLGHRDMIRAGAVPPALLTPTVRWLNLSFPVEELGE